MFRSRAPIKRYAVSSRTAAAVSLRSCMTASAPAEARTSVPYRPVATPSVQIPPACPHSMSAGVSPMTHTLWGSKCTLHVSAARSRAMGARWFRISLSEP